MEGICAKMAKDLIRKAESDRGVSLEDFYRGIKAARDVLNDRLDCARDELPQEVADEILR